MPDTSLTRRVDRTSIDDVLRDILDVENDSAPEDAIASEVVNLIAHEPVRAHIVLHSAKFLAYLCAPLAIFWLLAGAAIKLPTLPYYGGFFALVACVIPYVWLKRNYSEAARRQLLDSVANADAKSQLGKLIDLRDKFIDGTLQAVVVPSSGKDISVPKHIFDSKNSLNFLLPDKGKRTLVCDSGRYNSGRLVVLNYGTAANESKIRLLQAFKAKSVGDRAPELIYKCDEYTFKRVKEATLSAHPNYTEEFEILSQYRKLHKDAVTDGRKLYVTNADETIHASLAGHPSTRKIAELRKGANTTFEGKIVIPDS